MLAAGEDGKRPTTQCTIAMWGRMYTEAGKTGLIGSAVGHFTAHSYFHVQERAQNPVGMLKAVGMEGRLRALDRTTGVALIVGGSLSALAGDYGAAQDSFTSLVAPIAPANHTPPLAHAVGALTSQGSGAGVCR